MSTLTLPASPRAAAPTTENHPQTRWIVAEGVFDPAYERTNEALRRWVDGMEKALVARLGQRRESRASSARR